MGQSMSALPLFSDVNLLGKCDSIINFDAEISHGAFDFCVTEQELHGP